MNTSLVITVLAEDRPGIVSSLSEVLRKHHANWMESKMSRLAGKFAGLLHVSVAAEYVEPLKRALQALQSNEMLIQVEESESATDSAIDTPVLTLEILGQDRPGIIKDITSQLATLNVNIEEISSEQRVASMSNEILFFAELSLLLPATVEPEDVQDALEAMSDQLMVDLNFS